MNIDFCGSWAGAVWGSSYCGSVNPSCQDYVARNPSVYNDAYWLVVSFSSSLLMSRSEIEELTRISQI